MRYGRRKGAFHITFAGVGGVVVWVPFSYYGFSGLPFTFIIFYCAFGHLCLPFLGAPWKRM
jgi:hypothetical protein